jgi:DNA sulfur modification protein DndB
MKQRSPIIVPAIRALMGTTSYFQAVLRADELARAVQAAMDFREFESFMESERMQRDMNERRVEQQIIPYLCKSPDRFFGSIIVLVYEPDLFEFTSWDSFGDLRAPAAFRDGAHRAGVLEIAGGKLFALDGQHRLHALRTVVSGVKHAPRTGLPIEGEFREAVADDELSVIFIPFETTEKARRIFNKVNRYAKPTSHSTNILTSEDDGYAILTRCLIGVDDPDKFGGMDLRPLDLRRNGRHLIEFEKLNLDTASEHFSTLNAVHEMVKSISRATGQPDLDEKTNVIRPTDDVLAAAYDESARWFATLTAEFRPWEEMARRPYRIPGARHMEQPWSLVFRPKGQEAFVQGLATAHRRSRLSVKTLAKRANEMPLTLSHHLWQGILCGSNGKMITKHSALASRLVTYMLIGDDVGPKELSALEADFRKAKRDGNYTVRPLPRPVAR